MTFVQNVLRALFNVFGTRGNVGEEAWIDNDDALTPRERLVKRIGRVYVVGAIVNALVLVGVLLGLALGGVTTGAIADLTLRAWDSTIGAGTQVLVGLIAIGANISALLLLSSGARAQEFWTLVLLTVALVANISALVLVRFYPALLALVPLASTIVLSVRDFGAFHANAVATKELRGRMRGVRSFAIITIFLLLMGSFTVLLYMLQLPRLNTNDTIITGELGRLLFVGVIGIELLLIVFIVPALTAGAITGERERKTYDLLQTTLLSAPTFIVGKMESALGYIMLLLLSAIPLQSIAFLFGGVSGTEVLIALALLSVTGISLGALGMFFSAMTERTMTATVRVYTVAVVLVFGLPLVSFLLFGGAFASAITGTAVTANTPLQESVLIYGDMITSSLNPVTSAFYTQQILIDRQVIALFDVQLASNGNTIPVIAPWVLTSVIYTGITGVLILLAVWQMRRSS